MNESTVSDVPAHLILYLGADWWGSDARALAVALRIRKQLLVEVLYEDYFPMQGTSFSLRVLRRLGRSLFATGFNRAVKAHAKNRALDFVLVFKGMLLRPATLEPFRRAGIPLYCVYPDVSYKDHGRDIWDCLPLYDAVFTTKTFHLGDEELRSRVKALVEVEHGHDPEVHRPVALSDRIRAAYECDVSFVGCWSPKKEDLIGSLIKQLGQLDIRIYGPGWQHASAAVGAHWQKRGAFGDEYALICAASRINLGLLSEAGGGMRLGDQTTARTWQIPACGGFMLHERTEELARYFEPEKEVGTFSGATELVEKVACYLENDALRRSIAQAGLLRSRRDTYTYDAMAKTILNYHRDKVA
jgi:hypothetical protein